MALGAPIEVESLSVSARKPLMSNGSAKADWKDWRRIGEDAERKIVASTRASA